MGIYGIDICSRTTRRTNGYYRLVGAMSKRLPQKPGNLIKRNRYIIKKLASVSNAERKKILSKAPSELYKVINLIFKILNDSNTKIPKKHKEKIKQHKRFIQNTTDLKSSAIKRKIMNQKGGFWQALASVFLPLIGPAVKKIFKL